MEIINAHAHIYPDKIAEKATNAIGDFYAIDMKTSAGTVQKLIEDGSKAGITKYVVHSCATTAHQVRAINEFIKREMDSHQEFIGFMTLHQELTEEEIKEEIEWCLKNGFKGIKLHPDFQKFYIDGEDAEKIYRAVGDKMPILLHVGDKRYEFSKPIRLANIAKKYPEVNFICAHMGGYMCWDDADVFIGLDNVYFDTCSSLPFITISKARSIIKKLGAHKFFFATDFPMWDAVSEFERFNAIPLGENERKMIFSENIKKLLKLD